MAEDSNLELLDEQQAEVVLETRNRRYNAFGGIDLELNHPIYGWIPNTATPDDPDPRGVQIWEQVSAMEVGPYVPPPELTPEEIRAQMKQLTARQFRLGLVTAGMTPQQVTAVIAAMPAGPDQQMAQIEWEYATTFSRTHPLIESIGGALGLTPEQIDTMWTAALSL